MKCVINALSKLVKCNGMQHLLPVMEFLPSWVGPPVFITVSYKNIISQFSKLLVV